MVDKCESCTEKCPQAEMAHQAALGRMYTTREFITLLEKVESGELVEVVRCKDCKFWIEGRHHTGRCNALIQFHDAERYVTDEGHFCSYGERRK